MSDQAHPTSPTRLEPPRQSIDDPGAHELESSDNDEEHFSDALEGRHSREHSGSFSKRDSRYKGDAYGLQEIDPSLATSHGILSGERGAGVKADEPRTGTPQAPVVPLTVVEKVDPLTPSYGEVPGTMAHDMRKADAEPDIIASIDDSSGNSSRPRGHSTPGDLPIPTTKVSVVDSTPSHGDVPGTAAFEKRKGDAKPDIVESGDDHQVAPTSTFHSLGWKSPGGHNPWDDTSAEQITEEQSGPSLQGKDELGTGAGDDFEEFEEGKEADDFGDFDDGFTDENAAQVDDATHVLPAESLDSSLASRFPMLDYNEMKQPDELISATKEYLDELFPDAFHTDQSSPTSAPSGDSLFITERSLSLWSQLITPPPLQPPNWVRSRTRRLFLVSLGVPVDLDEILPASKQKKLVLPTIHPTSDRPSSETHGDKGRAAGVGDKSQNMLDAASKQQQPSSSSTPRLKGRPPPSEVDSASARILCNTTEEALAGLSDADLSAHVAKMEALNKQASEMLIYWQQAKESARGDKDAFEAVIENLVKHARRVRR